MSMIKLGIAPQADPFYLDFLDKDITFVLTKQTWNALSRVLNTSRPVLDLGCGIGTLLSNVESLMDDQNQIMGLTLNKDQLRNSKAILSKSHQIRADTIFSPFSSGSIGTVVSTMLIEHVDHHKFLEEVKRILVDHGILLLSTVLRMKGAWYFYKDNEGKSLLAPDHIREYSSSSELVDLLTQHGFRVKYLKVSHIKFSPIDGILRAIYRKSRIKFIAKVAWSKPVYFLRRRGRIPIMKYYQIELIVEKL